MIIPTTPINIPQITAKPSFCKRPKEIIKIPRPGIKLESGIGITINEEKIIVKNPIILSALWVVIKKRRGFRIISTLRMKGEDFLTKVATTDLFTDKLENLFGNFGEEYPSIIWQEKITKGRAMMLGNGGGSGIIIPKAKIIIASPNPIACIASTKSRIGMRSDED